MTLFPSKRAFKSQKAFALEIGLKWEAEQAEACIELACPPDILYAAGRGESVHPRMKLVEDSLGKMGAALCESQSLSNERGHVLLCRSYNSLTEH